MISREGQCDWSARERGALHERITADGAAGKDTITIDHHGAAWHGLVDEAKRGVPSR